MNLESEGTLGDIGYWLKKLVQAMESEGTLGDISYNVNKLAKNGGTIDSLLEAVMGISYGLKDVADAIRELVPYEEGPARRV